MILSPADIPLALADRARDLRLREGLTQMGLAERAGVSFGALKLFERTGKISLESLAKIAFALGREHDFDRVLGAPAVSSLAELERARPSRQRGTRR